MKVVDFDIDRELLERFLDFPRHHYASDPNWMPDPSEERLLADRSCSSAVWRNFLLMDGNRIRGRITAQVNSKLCDEEDQPYSQLGFLECENNLQVAQLLVDSAASWLKSNLPNGKTILAPMNFDTWHPYRLRTKGFGESTFMMEPYNPPYYPFLLAELGFSPISDYVTKTVNDFMPSLKAWEGFHSKAFSQGYSIRSFDLSMPDSEISLVYHLSTSIFRENLFYSDISEGEFRALYTGTAASLDPDLFLFILDPHGEPVGLCFSFTDHRQPDVVNVKTFGILPHVRSAGVGAALAYEVYKRFQAKGFLRANHCLLRSGNRADKFDGGLGDVTRTYTLYGRSL